LSRASTRIPLSQDLQRAPRNGHDSIGGVPPRPLTIKATLLPLRSLLSEAIISQIDIVYDVRRLDLPAADAVFTVDPEPKLHFVLAESKAGLVGGRTVHGPSATPMVPTAAAAASASAITASSRRPAVDAASPTLCTNILPAVARRRAGSTVSRKAKSSATTTLVGMPWPEASSTARHRSDRRRPRSRRAASASFPTRPS
jgi:hypothetical protein